LGELQFAFICFLVGQVYDGFERWKRLINVICRSEQAVRDHPGFFIDFMTVLHFQIKLVPQDFFADIVSNNNFLVDSLRRFFPNVADSGKGDDDPLIKRAKKFKEHLQDKFEWDFDEEPEDEMPVVVDL
jgi:A1 cistron-splicing factor AAR2